MMISRSKHRSTVEVCADCGASDPSWASINRGLLLCAECCSVHRSMGRHISHVKSLRQGSWPPSLLAMIQASAAQNVNSIWEHSLLDTSAPKHLKKKPQPKDPLHPTKSEFILAKHLRLAYILRARRDEPPSELGRQLHSAVRSSSLDTAMRLLAQGADPNYYNQEKGSHCLHSACRAGQAAQAELLVWWGARPADLDCAGNTPADVARVSGHTELGDRMCELVYEATDRLICWVSGSRPEHCLPRQTPADAGRHRQTPADAGRHRQYLQHLAALPPPPHPLTDHAKAARGKLQLLPNHLFEELVMDIYDEIDRRETEAIWQTSALGLERCGVVFLPVNPAVSAPRNQGRQKLARLSAAEVTALCRDVLIDATRRQHIATLHPAGLSELSNPMISGGLKHISQMSDDEPLYDSVASDDDYAALAPIDLDTSNVTLRSEAVPSTYNSTYIAETEKYAPPIAERNTQIETLKKELDSRNSTITELKHQLKNLQSIVEQLTKENSVLKTSSIEDDQSVTSQSQLSMNDSSNSATLVNVLEVKCQERGKSLETDQLCQEDDVKAKNLQRPVSMYETREGPKNNWQVTKHQLTTLSPVDRSLTQSAIEPGLPSAAVVQSRAEEVTRAIQELWAARDQPDRHATKADNIRRAVRGLRTLFPQKVPDRELSLVLSSLEAASAAVCGAGDLAELRAAAYDLAKATKTLVTHFQPS